ncbi:MAG TPA: right-handed parallel beta-helix repeat-containing protein, partial [Candidatus Krumholzibacteria bacterium]
LDVLAPSGGVHPYGGRAEMWTTDNYQTSGSVNPESCGGCPSDNYRYYSNFGKTSGASPEVASIAALLKSFMPGLTPAQVRQRLTTSAIDLGDAGPDSLYGYGRVDAYRALTEWGTIMGNVTWRPEDTADSTRYISGDLTIAPGDTLTIMPGTIIKIANDDDLRSGSDTLRVEINVEGVLIVDGTIGNPVVFESWHPQGTDDWVGIYFDSTSSGGSLDRCRISRAEIAVDSYAPLELTNTTIDSCSYAGVVSRKGGALIHGCQLSLPGDIGIRVDEDEVTVRSTTVDGALMHGISAYAGSSLAIRGSILTNSDTGLYVEGTASADVDSSSFFYQNDTGVHFYDAGTASTIRSCGITWNSSGGVLCDASSSPRIVSNIFAHNGGAIYCSNSSSPTIESNQIQSAGNAITVTSSSSPDVGHKPKTGSQSSGDNSIAHAVKYISNSTGASISAQNNCWNVNGTPPCSPAASKFVGTVDYTEPKCCSFPVFSHGEGEPDFGEGFIFQLPGDASPERKKPSVTGLFGILPNPFNPQTTIRYSLASQTRVEIAIYDVAGRLVQVLANETQVVGQHSLVWKGTDRRGSPVASGIYFVRMIAAGEVFTRKMVLLK